MREIKTHGPILAPNGRLIWKQYRETARTLLPVAWVEKGNPELGAEDPPAGVRQVVLNLFARRQSHTYRAVLEALAREAVSTGYPPEELLENLISACWVDKQVKLGRDGLSQVEVRLVPGDRLRAALAEQAGQQDRLVREWLSGQQALLERLRDGGRMPAGVPGEVLSRIISCLAESLGQVRCYLAGEGPVPEISWGGGTWRFQPGRLPNNFTLAVEFLLCTGYMLQVRDSGFEWKELGPVLYPGIGASKRFDRLRPQLLEFLETVSGFSPEQVGLISRGSLYSIYLVGDLTLQSSGGGMPLQVNRQTLAALTNIQVEEAAAIQSRAGKVLLTENRALLLKMYKTGWLARQPHLLVVGLDGRLRGAHRRLLQELGQAAGRNFYVWVDTDAAGQSIAAAVAGILPGTLFVLPPGQLCSFEEWWSRLQHDPALSNMEQEEYLGEPPLWDRLFL